MRFKVHERHLEHLDEEIETVGTYLGAYERNANQNKMPAAENSILLIIIVCTIFHANRNDTESNHVDLQQHPSLNFLLTALATRR